jgi:hypothetical protein
MDDDDNVDGATGNEVDDDGDGATGDDDETTTTTTTTTTKTGNEVLVPSNQICHGESLSKLVIHTIISEEEDDVSYLNTPLKKIDNEYNVCTAGTYLHSSYIYT